jgi:SAM-dependent methyltransferase
LPESQELSLERLLEDEDLGIEVLHPGGLDITRELASMCGIGKGTTVLDVATGTGEGACFLAETLRARVVGVDISEVLLQRARSKAAARDLQVDFRQGDANRLDLADDSFQVVVCECSMCLMDKQRAMREMVRVAERGGRVGMHDLCWREEPPAQIRDRLAELEGERPERLADWKSLFTSAGLVDLRTVDKSSLLRDWTESIEQALGLSGRLRLFLKVARAHGISGLLRVLESERIFRSRYLGYGIVVGTKP